MNPGLRFPVTSAAPQSPSCHPPVPRFPPTLPPPSSTIAPHCSAATPAPAQPPLATVEFQTLRHTHFPARPVRHYSQPAPHRAAPSANFLHKYSPHTLPTPSLPY